MRRHDANDRVLATVEQDVLSEQVSVTEPSRQKSVTDQDCVPGSWPVLFRKKHAAQQRLYAPQAKKILGRFNPVQLSGFPAEPVRLQSPRVHSGDAREAVSAFSTRHNCPAQVCFSGIQPRWRPRKPRPARPVAERESAKQHRVRDAKNGNRRANAQHQGYESNRGKTGRPCQHA
jgi:hypothetical protein